MRHQCLAWKCLKHAKFHSLLWPHASFSHQSFPTFLVSFLETLKTSPVSQLLNQSLRYPLYLYLCAYRCISVCMYVYNVYEYVHACTHILPL